MRFLEDPPRFVFFTGKGGVGKTSLACASAVELAGRGRSVLLVSTDPASNVAQVLGVPIGNTVTPIEAVPGLSCLEIDPEAAAEAYRERIVGPVRGLLPEREIVSITEQLSGSCTTEVASFNEFTALLAGQEQSAGYDHVVFDTAPTGHTIRLLQLPGSWTGFLEEGKGDASCLGPLAGLDRQRTVYAAAVAALQDPERTRLVLVARAQESALSEIDRTYAELTAIGIRAANVVINGVLPQGVVGDDPLAAAIQERETRALTLLSPSLAALPRDTVPLLPTDMVGVPALRMMLGTDRAATDAAGEAPLTVMPSVGLNALVDEIEVDGRGLVLCMGKGGVGKTTIAAAIAVSLAERGHQVHLTTTDPAAHLEQTLAGSVANLRVSRIDPVEATAAYRERIMTSRGRNLDDAGRARLAEDLLSPCTEEIAVFQAFSKVVLGSRHEFVVVDTAPTGHTLLLLDAAGSYHRDVMRQSGGQLAVRTPLMTLQDPKQTKVLLVTLAEPTPVQEAQALQEDLRRAGINPWAWVINGSLAAAGPRSPLLRQRAAHEQAQIAAVTGLADRVAVVPLQVDEPVGEAGLAELVEVVAAS